MKTIVLTVPEAKHLLTLLADAAERGDYYGNRTQYWRRHQRIVDKLEHAPEDQAMKRKIPTSRGAVGFAAGSVAPNSVLRSELDNIKAEIRNKYSRLDKRIQRIEQVFANEPTGAPREALSHAEMLALSQTMDGAKTMKTLVERNDGMGSTLIVVDCEAPVGVGAPSVGDMTEFGAVDVNALREGRQETFHGTDCSEETFRRFRDWLAPRMPVVFVSDNPAYDFQWINFYFWKYFNTNPFGHSGRRIADFYAGLVGDFRSTQKWKRLRRTKHDHHPVHDALGNAEALIRILDGER